MKRENEIGEALLSEKNTSRDGTNNLYIYICVCMYSGGFPEVFLHYPAYAYSPYKARITMHLPNLTPNLPFPHLSTTHVTAVPFPTPNCKALPWPLSFSRLPSFHLPHPSHPHLPRISSPVLTLHLLPPPQHPQHPHPSPPPLPSSHC